MSVNIRLAAVEIDGVRYWRTSDVITCVTELLVSARTEDEQVLIAWFLRAMQKAQREPIK